MTRLVVIAFTLAMSVATVQAQEIAVTMNKLDHNGIGDAIGVIVIQQSPQGLVLKPYIRGLHAGNYKFAIHENVGCTAGFHADGRIIPGAGAGKMLRTLPVLFVNDMGEANEPIILADTNIDTLRGRTLVVYDTDQTTRIACGSLEDYMRKDNPSIFLR